MFKFINQSQSLVIQALKAYVSFRPSLTLLADCQAVRLAHLDLQRVHIVCGGGAGHEPAHAGFVEEQVLSCAIIGNVFASPSTPYIVKALKHFRGAKGVLLIVKNYGGDLINFGQAASQLSQQLAVKSLLFGDDISFYGEKNWRSKARGLCGTVLLYKILGSLSSKLDLEQIYKKGGQMIERIFSLNYSLSGCCLPDRQSSFTVQRKTVHVGTGIHGEKSGVHLEFRGADQIVQDFIQRINRIVELKQCSVIINNLGSTTDLQLYSLAGSFMAQSNWKIRSLAVGKFMTALEMHGISFTILIEPTQYQLQALNRPSENWRSFIPASMQSQKNYLLHSKKRFESEIGLKINKVLEGLDSKLLVLDNIDRQSGDGDTGSSMKKFILFALQQVPYLDFEQQFKSSLKKLICFYQELTGGTLGVVLGKACQALFQQFNQIFIDNQKINLLSGLRKAISQIRRVGRCEAGQKTILDFAILLQQWLSKSNMIDNAVIQQWLASIKQMSSKHGRASYRADKAKGLKDPGCQLLAYLIKEWIC